MITSVKDCYRIVCDTEGCSSSTSAFSARDNVGKILERMKFTKRIVHGCKVCHKNDEVYYYCEACAKKLNLK